MPRLRLQVRLACRIQHRSAIRCRSSLPCSLRQPALLLSRAGYFLPFATAFAIEPPNIGVGGSLLGSGNEHRSHRLVALSAGLNRWLFALGYLTPSCMVPVVPCERLGPIS